jgi:hypothetical protein
VFATGAGACVDSGGSLIVVQTQDPVVTDKVCGPPMGRAGRRSEGTLDVALDRDYAYFMYPLVSNLMPAIANKEADVEPNRVEVTGARVRIEPPPGVNVPWQETCPAEFDYAGRVTLKPGEEGSIPVEALRPCHARLLRELFSAGALDSRITEIVRFRVILRAKGRHGGSGIVSDPFEYPLRVCFGCLQTGFPDAEFAQFNFPQVPNCSKLFVNPYTGNPCHPAQDKGPILCCARDGRPDALECPGLPRAPRPAGTMTPMP